MKKLNPNNNYPLDYRLLWIFGFKPKPPLFESFIFNFVREAIIMGLSFFALSYLDRVFRILPVQFSLSGSILVSILCGISMGWYRAKRWAELARKQGLK